MVVSLSFAQVDPKASERPEAQQITCDSLRVDTIRILHKEIQKELREIMKKSDEAKRKI